MRNILVYKLVLLNTLAIAWLSVTNYQSGWFTKLFYSDTSGINYATAALFGVVFLGTIRKALSINIEYNYMVDNKLMSLSYEGNLRLKRMEWIERAAGWMLFLGLIGTLYGLMMSLSGVNSANVNSVDGLKTIGVQLISGLRIEISTTLIGAMAALWTEVNYVTMKYTTDILVTFEEECHP